MAGGWHGLQRAGGHVEGMVDDFEERLLVAGLVILGEVEIRHELVPGRAGRRSYPLPMFESVRAGSYMK